MSRIPRTLKITGVFTFLMVHAFAIGFWAGSDWKEKHLDGTLVRNRNDALIYLRCTPIDTPQECARKLAAEWQREGERERDEIKRWRIAEPK